MIYITLHNLHTWGKKHMTKAGDICVAASLAGASDHKTVHVAATNGKNLDEVRDLYPEVRFEKFDNSVITANDAIIVPIMEFSRILEDTRDELVQFYKDLLDSKAKLFVMNIHHNKEFYKKTIESGEDREVVELVDKILERCHYLTHDDCMNLERYDSECIQQIVFYDKDAIRDVQFANNRDIALTFYRPSSFKGFNLWLEQTKIENRLKLVAVCNTSVNKKYDSLVKEYIAEGLITKYETISEYLIDPCEGHALISAPYSIEDADFQELIRRSLYCLNTTDYNVLADLNEGVKPDYLILENAMFDASMHQLPLRWTMSSIDTMPVSTKFDCILTNSLDFEEQVELFDALFNAKTYLEKSQRKCE